MSDSTTTKSIYGILRQYLRDRSDLGIGNAVRDSVLEPLNPFDTKATRAPRRWFVLFGLAGGLLLGCFVYFNNLI
jgi:hypothetical protein